MRSCDDPILAVSSPPGRAPRGLIRITAPDLTPLLEHLLEQTPPPRHLTPLKARGLPSPGLSLPTLALYFQSPHTFTSTDLLELQLPGNPALLHRACESLLTIMRQQLGEARYAEPGEFTQRAFLAGRIDLTRAEGISATISAVSDAQLEAARLLRTGKLGQWAVDLVEALAQHLALVEAGIDFVDQDDVVPITPGKLDEALGGIESQLRQMLARSRSWAALEALPWVVLVGEPNVGKSTLLNALLGHDRAVASDQPGTTRDILAEPMKLGGGEVMLVDVAGLDEPAGALDASMQSAARDAIARAELILQLHDHEHPLTPLIDDATPVIQVQTKCDAIAGSLRDPGSLHISAVTGEGLDTLRGRIAEALSDRAVTLAGQMLALQPRHHDELTAALDAIIAARHMLVDQLDSDSLADMELVAAVLRQGLDHLGALGGQMSPDDVIGRIFATFCIGK